MFLQHVTERLVKLVLSDLPKVILDYPKAKKKKKCDTGGFVLCHKAKMQVEKPLNGLVTNLAIEGKKLTKWTMYFGWIINECIINLRIIIWLINEIKNIF